MAKLYLECSAGISGDMTAAALIDLGADREAILRALESLPLEGFRVEISTVEKSGLAVCDFDVQLDGVHENHDHDMEWLFGDPGAPRHEDHSPAACEHRHSHRTLSDVYAILDQGEPEHLPRRCLPSWPKPKQRFTEKHPTRYIFTK